MSNPKQPNFKKAEGELKYKVSEIPNQNLLAKYLMEKEGKYSPYFVFQMSDGKKVTIIGCYELISQMSSVPLNSLVNIDFLGQEDIGDGKTRMKVAVQFDDTYFNS